MAIQHLGGPHSGAKATIVKGDTVSRAMGQYGQNHSFMQPKATVALGQSAPTPPLPPGPNGSVGSPRSYPAAPSGMDVA